MGVSVRIYDFDRFKKQYLLDHETGALTRAPEEPGAAAAGPPANRGNLKRFLVGAAAIAYVLDGVPYLRRGSRVEPITRSDAVEQRDFGPFSCYRFNCGSIRGTAFGTNFLEFIARRTDPTYDNLDRLGADFAGFVRGLHEKRYRRP
jgi:hypothetical protein